jgi:hypothetical protein
MTDALAIRHADNVEAIADTGAIWSLRLGDCQSDQRQALIDHHAKVMRLLRRRGHRVRAGIVHDDLDGECLTLRILSGPAWRTAERA